MLKKTVTGHIDNWANFDQLKVCDLPRETVILTHVIPKIIGPFQIIASIMVRNWNHVSKFEYKYF